MRPRYGVTQTLLDCSGGPDVNRRTLVDTWNGYAEVCVFNRDMRAWSAQDATRLKLVVEALNMLPSCEAMAKNVKAHCAAMAKEISRRVAEDPQNSDGTPYNVQKHAMVVLLDWFLGDMLPGGKTDSTSTPQTPETQEADDAQK
jgi:hypothetical protein